MITIALKYQLCPPPLPGWTARSAPASRPSATPPTRTSSAAAPPPAPPRHTPKHTPSSPSRPYQQQQIQHRPPIYHPQQHPYPQGYPQQPPGYYGGGGPPSLRAPSLRPAYHPGVPAPPPDRPLDGQGLTPAQAYQAQVAHGAQWQQQRSHSPAPPHAHQPTPQQGPPALSVAIGGDGGRLGISFDSYESPASPTNHSHPPNGNGNGNGNGGGEGGEEDDEESELPWARPGASSASIACGRSPIRADTRSLPLPRGEPRRKDEMASTYGGPATHHAPSTSK
ncbi:hypothetical protein B0H14DRAFT_3518030 [Mycena olivaceomarginata]|nr:hypothetical protein B0H14DRAFT_3518030 [Mycena olivaceomarginata]